MVSQICNVHFQHTGCYANVTRKLLPSGENEAMDLLLTDPIASALTPDPPNCLISELGNLYCSLQAVMPFKLLS